MRQVKQVMRSRTVPVPYGPPAPTIATGGLQREQDQGPSQGPALREGYRERGSGPPKASKRERLEEMKVAQKGAYGMSFADYVDKVNQHRGQGAEILYDGASQQQRPSLRPGSRHRKRSTKQQQFWNWGQGGFYDTRQSYDETMSSSRILRVRDVTAYGFGQRPWMN